MTDQTVKASEGDSMDQPDPLEPTQAEIDAWVARERARRQAWLNGPTEEERNAYANQLRHRFGVRFTSVDGLWIVQAWGRRA